jgi:conjugal transfer mating pair stabilization protein TraG
MHADFPNLVQAQPMMMNVIRDGIVNYQAYMNSSASVVNQAFIKSQAQQRYTWQLLGMKASWALPLLHSVLTFLILALFPLIIVLVVAYGGSAMFKSVLQFFLSMQLWPPLFAILNLAMTFAGKGISGQYEHFNLYSIDYLTELHSDIAGVAGFLSMSIPWLSFGVVGRLGDTFNSLANSMSSSLQSATISSAQEAAGASFSLGQTSFYNATGNMLSANKHDSNFSSFSGSTIRQLDSGATIATSADGNEVIDASSAVSRGTVSISSNNAISGMLNRAYENSLQSVSSHSRQFHGAISEGLHHLSQLSQMDAKDLRLGEGTSESDSSHLQSSVSRLLGTAESVADKLGITREQALTGIVSAGMHSQVGFNTKNSALGKLGGFVFGADGSLYVKGHAEKTDSTSDRYHTGMDKVLDAREVRDFRSDYNTVQNFTKTHHVDSSYSHGANLVAQTAGDLREAESVARSLDASLAQSERISTARSVTESGGAAISHNLDQMFQEYVKEQVGTDTRNELYGHPGDAAAQAQLQTLANQFLQDGGMQQRIIDTYGNQSVNPAQHYQENSTAIASEDARLYQKYFSNRKILEGDGAQLDVGVSHHDATSLKNKVQQGLAHVEHRIDANASSIADSLEVRRMLTREGIQNGQQDASTSAIIHDKIEKIKQWNSHEKA